MLTLDYRPKTFSDLVGQDSARVVLRALVVSHQTPSALLFSGTRGSGKTSAARIFAAALNCESPNEGDACGVCSPCQSIQAGNSSSVVEIDAASHGGVEDVRTLQELVQFSVPGNYRIVILDEAHSMSKPAFNALLKVLEEGPPKTVFLLLTTEPDKILDTVRSRCMSIPFRNVPTAAIIARLNYVCEKEGIEYEGLALEEIARHCEGSVRDAIMVLDQVRLLGPATVSSVRAISARLPVVPDLLAALILHDQSKAVQIGRNYFEASGDIPGFLADLFDGLQERLNHNVITPKQMVQATRLIWQTREHRGVRDGRMVIEALITLLYGVLYEEKTSKTSKMPILGTDPKSSKSALTSLEELAALAEE